MLIDWTLAFGKAAVLTALTIAVPQTAGAQQVAAAAADGGGAGLTAGDKCKVTEGPNKGKTGTFGDDGWCEGDWGGTECGEGNKKCEAVSAGRPGSGVISVFDAPASAVMARDVSSSKVPSERFRAVGAIRANPGGGPSVQLTDRSCSEWTTIPDAEVVSMELLSVPSVDCADGTYPVARLHLTAPPRGHDAPGRSGGAMVTRLFRLSGAMNVPHLSGGLGLINDADWDRCVDIYLDCQLDTCGEDGGIFESPQLCEDHCDAVFDACTFDPF